MRLATMTLGCKVNTYDTEAMEELFVQEGYELVSFEEVADVYLINTCTVTNFGDKKSRQMIRRAKKQNPVALVVVTGCYAQVSPAEVEKIEGVNLVIGTKDRNKIVSLVQQAQLSPQKESPMQFVSDIMKERTFENLSIKQLKDRTRAYVKIQEGCDRFCAYCIIPYARGPVRSRQPQDVLDEVTALSHNGFREIVLAGIHVASYGKDLKNTDLLQLLGQVHDVEGIERIRFSSMEPGMITTDFVYTIKSLEKVCHHMHLSLQSGCDQTLQRMNRRYTTQQFADAVRLLREVFPDIALTTDVIVGFPGETEEDFEDSMRFCATVGFRKIHVFPFSAKKGTKAYDMKEQVPNDVKERRSKKMLQLDAQLQQQFLENTIGKKGWVLFEKEVSPGIYEGHTSNYVLVRVTARENLLNTIRPVVFEKIQGETLLGSVENL